MRYVVPLFALAVLIGCFRPDPVVGDCDALLRGDRNGEREAQVIRDFNTYPLEARYRLYICGSQNAHPSWGLEWPFAEGGEEAARFLTRKLEATEYDATISDIIVVFWAMRQRGTFDASTDPALMSLIDRKVASLDGALRNYGETYVREIRDGPVAQARPTIAEPSPTQLNAPAP